MKSLAFILAVGCSLVSGPVFAGEAEEATFHTFLRSESLTEQKKAFSEIVAHGADYKSEQVKPG